MAALSLTPKGTGYFGHASSSVLLRALRVNSWDLTVNFSTHDLLANPLGKPMSSLDSSQMFTDTLVDSFFTFYNTSYPFIHEPTFRAQYLGTMTRPRQDVWDLLLNAVLALGSWCINHEDSFADVGYYQNAKYRLTSRVLETGSLPLVQALTLLSNYVQKRNKPNTGWNYLGLAIRMALGLGLYREFPGWKSSPLKLEMRRRVWWGLFIFDAGAAITFGRPINLPSTEIIDVKPVLNITDDMLTYETTVLPKELDQPTIYSGLIQQAKFTLITNKIYNRLVSRPAPTADDVLEMNKQIEQFVQELPPYFQEDAQDELDWDPTNEFPSEAGFNTTNPWLTLARYRLQWRCKNLQIIMFRPFVLQRVLYQGDRTLPNMNSLSDKECRRICLKKAHETINSVDLFLTNYARSTISIWYAVYFLFQACLVPLLCHASESMSEHAPDWLDDVEKTKKVLLCLCSENRLARRFLDVVERLYSQYISEEQAKTSWMTDIYDLVVESFPDREFDLDGPIII